MKKIVILGTGGHARMVATLIHDMAAHGHEVSIAGYSVPVGELDQRRDPIGGKVLGEDTILPELARNGTATHFAIGRGSVLGGETDRPRLFDLAVAAGLEPASVWHHTATVFPTATLGGGAVLMAGSIVCADVVLGPNVIVNTNSSVDHDGKIGAHTHISAGVTLAGTVTVGSNCFIGVGSTISHSIVIGDDVTVGAGAMVIRDVESGRIVKGVPAK